MLQEIAMTPQYVNIFGLETPPLPLEILGPDDEPWFVLVPNAPGLEMLVELGNAPEMEAVPVATLAYEPPLVTNMAAYGFWDNL